MNIPESSTASGRPHFTDGSGCAGGGSSGAGDVAAGSTADGGGGTGITAADPFVDPGVGPGRGRVSRSTVSVTQSMFPEELVVRNTKRLVSYGGVHRMSRSTIPP